MARPRKHEDILEAARAVFLSEGFEGASMDRIAEAAGVSKRTVYNNFADKEALFGAVVERLWQGLRFDDATEALGCEDVRQALGRIAERVLDTLLRPEVLGMLRVVVAESVRSPALAQTFYRRAKEPAIRRLAEYLARMDGRGRLHVPFPELAAAQFLGLFKEALFWPRLLGMQPPLAEHRSAVIAQAVETFLRAHAAERPGPGLAPGAPADRGA